MHTYIIWYRKFIVTVGVFKISSIWMAHILSNKVALVTGWFNFYKITSQNIIFTIICFKIGATRGIGKGIALQLGQNGAKVYITGRTLKANKIGQSLEDTQNEVNLSNFLISS